jgi:glycerol-3-phosphate acyltransferase PlsX
VTARVIAIDAMGSDRAPGPDVAGAIAAVREAPLEVLLVGDGPRLEAELARIGAARERGVTVVHAPEVVAHDEHPGAAYRAKRQSSLRVAIDQVASGPPGPWCRRATAARCWPTPCSSSAAAPGSSDRR